MSKLHEGQPPAAPAPAQTKQPITPAFASLQSMPDTPEALFRSVALSLQQSIQQIDPTGNSAPQKHDYALPWVGFGSWHDARERLAHFENHFAGKIQWAPFNDSVSNDGPMSLNAYPGRAFIERVTNEGDANLEAKALDDPGPMPSSPADAAERWFKLTRDHLVKGDDDQIRDLARSTVTVTGFIGDPKDHKDSIFDARDYGIGLTGAEMPGTILSLNRGNKKSKPWLTGKHGQGASSTYQYSDLTLIASRKEGVGRVAFTFVEATWDVDANGMAKTPTYRYLTVDGKIAEVVIPTAEFPAGTLVRHIGYTATDLLNPIGQNSLYGLLLRSLAEPLFPVWLEIFSLRTGKAGKLPTFPGYRRFGRVIRGSVNALERAYQQTLTKAAASAEDSLPPEDESLADSADAEAPSATEADGDKGTRILHRASEYFQLPKWDYGARTGIGDLGRVKITYWVIDPAKRKSQDVLRSYVDPDKTILMTLDGQTHAEESRTIITGQTGAKLWAVGKYMVVQIDCNDLDPRAKYELFTSTREHAKETPIKKMIIEELVRRLGFDKKLEQLNVQLAAADIKQPEEKSDTISSLIKKYLKAAGISFEQITRKVEKWIDIEELQEVADKSKEEPPPIEAVEPPTFIRWKFSGTTIKMHPGQKYSFIFETDASPSYWNPADQLSSKIRVTAHGVQYLGAGEMKGGRVRCHFECPESTPVGTKAFIQVQMEYALGASKHSMLQVEITPKPQPKPKPPQPPPSDEEGPKKLITVKVRKKDFSEVEIPVVQPIPVTQKDNHWLTLGWPHDRNRVGFSIRSLAGKVHLYYNAEFPPFLDLRHRMSKKSLESEFVRRYELKLVLHTIFSLNYDFVDEEEFSEEQKKRMRDLLCATAESLALATKSELEIESKLKSEDATSLESSIATTLQ